MNLFEDPDLAPDVGDQPPRALIMAGGGLKVAFQAGVLQVWLDEARDAGRPLEFDHADGASGGVYNLAMWCQGMSGRRIADNWRRFSPVLDGLGVDPRGWLRGRSLFTMDRFRREVLRGRWGLDWERIRTCGRSAGFNVFDVDSQRLVTLPPGEMSEDMLVAGTSLPGWYPPVRSVGRSYIDGVFVTDANLGAAIAAGADELWVVWTVSTAGRWRGGPVNQYFQVIEACANGRLRQDLDRIARNNRACARGQSSEFGRPIRVVGLQHEVPQHYLFTFTRRSVAQAVELGVQVGRAWCRRRGLEVDTRGDHPSSAPVSRSVTFRERMTGPVAFVDLPPPEAAEIGDAQRLTMALRLRVEIDDLAGFQADPRHCARVSGAVDSPALGGTSVIERGSVVLLPDTGGRGSTMEYRLDVSDMTGRELTLVGVKTVRNDPGPDLWSDTTTLDLTMYPRCRPQGPSVLAGRLRLSLPALLRTMVTMRGRERYVLGYGTFLLRRLTELYVRQRPGGPRALAPLPGWPDGQSPEGAAVFVSNERVVPAPVDEVWPVLVRAGRWSSFYRNAWWVRVDGDRDGLLRPGSVFTWTTFGLSITSVVTLFDAERGVLGWRWWGLGARGYHLWSLQPHPLGTRIRTQETQRGVVPRLLAPLLRRVMPYGHGRWLRGIGRRASS